MTDCFKKSKKVIKFAKKYVAQNNKIKTWT